MKVRYIRFHPTDWLEGTVELSHLERSVYITICACIYARGGPVELNHIRKFCPGHGFQQGVERLVKRGKITLSGAWSGREPGVTAACQRCATELSRARQRTEQAVTNGAKGGRPNGLAEPDGFQNRKPIPILEPITTIKKEDFALSSESEEREPDGSHAAAPRRPRATKTPPMAPLDQWGPSPAHQQQAMLAGHDDVWLFDQADRYRDQQANAKLKHRDREAGFRNWIRNSPNFQPQPNGHAGNAKFKPSPMNNFAKGFADALRERQEKRQREENIRTDFEPGFALLDS